MFVKQKLSFLPFLLLNSGTSPAFYGPSANVSWDWQTSQRTEGGVVVWCNSLWCYLLHLLTLLSVVTHLPHTDMQRHVHTTVHTCVHNITHTDERKDTNKYTGSYIYREREQRKPQQYTYYSRHKYELKGFTTCKNLSLHVLLVNHGRWHQRFLLFFFFNFANSFAERKRSCYWFI